MALVVMRGEKTVLAQGYGRTAVDGGGLVTDATVFQLGSISKQFLAALVLRLAEEERLSLDDPVTKHLPEFALLPPTVTVRHLLNHTSGMRELFAQEVYRDGIEDLSRGPEELARIARESPVDFAPGSRWSYSNTGYATLALIVGRLTGQPYEDALAERLFTPLGLPSMRQCTPLPKDDGEARGHVDRDGAVIKAAPENMHWIRGDGGLCGHARDLARWTRLLHTGQVVSPASYALMTAPAPLSSRPAAPYGFGLSLIDPDGRRKVAHGGAMLGFSAMAAWYPDDEVAVVVLTNRGEAGADGIERRIARGVLGLPEPARTPVALTALVSQGTRELGIRMALGATPGRVARMVVGGGMTTALIGIAVGVAGAAALTRFMQTLLFEVEPIDPMTFGLTTIALAAIAFVATYAPARRASKIDPLVALRTD